MQCSYGTLAQLFYNVSSSFLLLFLFFYFTSILLAKLFHYCGAPVLQRTQEENDFAIFSEEEEEEEGKRGYFGDQHAESNHPDHLVAEIAQSEEALRFLPARNPENRVDIEEWVEKLPAPTAHAEREDAFLSPLTSESQLDGDDEVDEEIQARDTTDEDSSDNNSHHPNDHGISGTTSSTTVNLNKSSLSVIHDETHEEKQRDKKSEEEEVGRNLKLKRESDEKFLVYAPAKSEARKQKVRVNKDTHEEEEEEEEIYGDSCTVGSTSKSSSEWRSSINWRDSGTEDPFSSSSRRSCPKWESYTLFQKYDEEMLFFDRISAQKLHETESLRSIQACPRSISERIVYKLSARNNKRSSKHNPYQELEAAYVAQICLTWEALNWNYKNFQLLRASRRESDPGCPAYIGQQFQQFQVLLQRYIENEPYEHGRRPEIYARMRSFAPKLLQVPEYRDSYDEEKEEVVGSRISSELFLQIMEEAIRTFTNFLKADKASRCQILAAFFRRNRRGSVDPTRLLLLKKINKKKKSKIKDLYRGRKCLRKRRLTEGEEMEILMALIDMMVVSRVLRMSQLSEEQLHWCNDKMNKVRVGDGKLRRDSSPLFFPAH
ncbi:hypothetical protein NMG60_11024070 [Bertholletia excelsa]